MRRRFGSAPEVHLKSAREAVKAARWWLREARRQTKSGDCKQALDSLVTANRMSAVATSERRGSGRSKAFFQASTLRAAMNRFARACVVRGRVP